MREASKRLQDYPAGARAAALPRARERDTWFAVVTHRMDSEQFYTDAEKRKANEDGIKNGEAQSSAEKALKALDSAKRDLEKLKSRFRKCLKKLPTFM